MDVHFRDGGVDVSVSGFVKTVGCNSSVTFNVQEDGYFKILMGNAGRVRLFNQTEAIVFIEEQGGDGYDYLQNVDPRVSNNIKASPWF